MNFVINDFFLFYDPNKFGSSVGFNLPFSINIDFIFSLGNPDIGYVCVIGNDGNLK